MAGGRESSGSRGGLKSYSSGSITPVEPTNPPVEIQKYLAGAQPDVNWLMMRKSSYWIFLFGNYSSDVV
jgi:hypothetical protein